MHTTEYLNIDTLCNIYLLYNYILGDSCDNMVLFNISALFCTVLGMTLSSRRCDAGRTDAYGKQE